MVSSGFSYGFLMTFLLFFWCCPTFLCWFSYVSFKSFDYEVSLAFCIVFLCSSSFAAYVYPMVSLWLRRDADRVSLTKRDRTCAAGPCTPPHSTRTRAPHAPPTAHDRAIKLPGQLRLPVRAGDASPPRCASARSLAGAAVTAPHVPTPPRPHAHVHVLVCNLTGGGV